MISLLLAIFLSTGILICFRIFERYKINLFQAIVWNYVLAASLGFFLSYDPGKVKSILTEPWFPYALIIGVFFIAVFNLFGHSSQKIGIAITAVASKMSVVIPVSLGIVLYGESLGFIKFSGIVMAIIAFWVVLGGNRDSTVETLRNKSKYWYLPLLLFLGNGINDSLMKHVETTYLQGSSMLLISIVFIVSLCLGALASVISSIRHKTKWELKNILAGFILGLLNLGSTFFFFECMAIFSNTFFFPVFNVSMVMLSALTGALFFSETIGKRKLFGILLAIVSIILIALSV